MHGAHRLPSGRPGQGRRSQLRRGRLRHDAHPRQVHQVRQAVRPPHRVPQDQVRKPLLDFFLAIQQKKAFAMHPFKFRATRKDH